MRRFSDFGFALLGGVLLAMMIHLNSGLSRLSSPVFSSWVAHGVGSVAALFLMTLNVKNQGRAVFKGNRPAPWYFLGGVPGVFTVILAGLTVNSPLQLSGTISLMLVGQVIFGFLLDSTGLLGAQRRRLSWGDLGSAICILVGSGLMIFGRHPV
ncbi:EamA-like transporter family protein [bacterium]|jgi:transporter family-2 protein|nr:EamA-like transporter family protein [bacterium]